MKLDDIATLEISESAYSREAPTDVQRLTKPTRSSFKSFRLESEPQLYCGPDDVRIATESVGLNFRDVLIALNKYPDASAPLGLEFSGRIIQQSPSHPQLKIGQRVFGVMLASFANELVIPARALSPTPEQISPSVAAGLPVAYMTAWRGLVEMAQVKAGQKVLIHNGTGGVGLAAIHLARKLGATVIATAGMPEKREYLNKIGIKTALNSRDASFVQGVLNATDGQGVDVVIGALPPTLSRANLDVLAHGGHFVDLGKLGGLDDAGIKALRPDIQHSVMSLDIDAISDPVWVGKTLRSIKSELSNGALAYLPVKEFPVSDADKAFRYLAKTQHIGKVVLRFP